MSKIQRKITHIMTTRDPQHANRDHSIYRLAPVKKVPNRVYARAFVPLEEENGQPAVELKEGDEIRIINEDYLR